LRTRLASAGPNIGDGDQGDEWRGPFQIAMVGWGYSLGEGAWRFLDLDL
jgi:hypothetical protein